MDLILASTISVVVGDTVPRPVDGKLLKVGIAVSVQLSIEVREDAALQQGILSKVDASHNVTGLEHYLLRLGEVVSRVDIQLHRTQNLKRRKLLWDDLGRIKEVEAERESLALIHNLHGEIPHWAITGSNGVEQILAVEIGVFPRVDLCLLPKQSGFPLSCLPVPFDELRGTILRDHAEGVNTKAILRDKVSQAAFERSS